MLPDSSWGSILLLALAACAGPTHIDFDAPGATLRAGCGGALDDWESVRGLDDPGNGSFRSLGTATDGCLVLPARAARDLVVSARVTFEDGPVGFAIRYRGPDDYL